MLNKPSYITAPVENTRLRFVIPILVAVITFIVFLPALKNGFLDWDDGVNFVDNLKYRGLGWEQLKWMFTTSHMGPYQPLSWITYGLDYLIWGMDPFGYHLTNVILHSINAAVFCILCVKLLTLAAGPIGRERKTDLYLSACFAALFFSIHPLRVESVAWVTERRDVLSGLFYIMAMVFYIQPYTAGGENTSFWRRHSLPLATFLLALLSKGMAVSLPIVLLVLDVYPLKRLPLNPGQWLSQENSRIWLEKIPYFALSIVFGIAGYIFQANLGTQKPYQVSGLAPHAAQVIFPIGFYVWKTLIPLNLAPLYKLTGSLLGWKLLLAGGAALTITAGAISLHKRWPALLAVWVYYLAVLSPVSGIVKFGSLTAADRYTYLPCLGFAMLAGAGFWASRQASGKLHKNIFTLAACLIIAGFGALSWRQTKVWHDSKTLWTHAINVNPELEVAQNNLANILLQQGDTAEAQFHYREALRIKPEYADAHFNLGCISASQGKFDEALVHYREALRFNPDSYEAENNIAIALAAQGKPAEAIMHYQKALHNNPGFAEANTNIGAALLVSGKPGEAIKYFREALRIKPDSPDAHYNWGLALASQGNLDEAIAHYREALRIKPDYPDAHYGLGLALGAQGKLDEALAHYQEAVRLEPDDAKKHNYQNIVLSVQGKLDETARQYLEALRINPGLPMLHYNLSVTLAAQGKLDEAVKHYREALRINPDFVEAHINLSAILYKQGKVAEAIKHCREALRIDPDYAVARNNLAAMLKKQPATVK